MTALIPHRQETPQTAAFLGAMVLSALALAQSTRELELPPEYAGALRTEILEDAEDWRRDAADEVRWREPAPAGQVKGRIEFGMDSLYDEPRIRRALNDPSTQSVFDEPRPNTLLRFQFGR